MLPGKRARGGRRGGPPPPRTRAGQGGIESERVLGEEYELLDKANLDLSVAGGEIWVTSFNADRIYHVPLPRM